MSERLTDEELTDLVIRAGALGDRSKHLAREAVAELRDRRSRDLSAEDAEALRHARVIIQAADCGDVADEPLRARALAILDRLLTSEVRR